MRIVYIIHARVLSPHYSCRRRCRERRVLFEKKLWRNVSTFGSDSMYVMYLAPASRTAFLSPLCGLCVLCG